MSNQVLMKIRITRFPEIINQSVLLKLIANNVKVKVCNFESLSMCFLSPALLIHHRYMFYKFQDYHLNEDLVQEIFKDVNASTANLCLPKKSKVVILVIDALKYEFGLYNPDLDNPLPFENRINIFNELLTAQPDHSRLLKFRADPPTTTLQRLKGLTTGSLPTFIDIGSNFATPEINEDNIIDQVSAEIHEVKSYSG